MGANGGDGLELRTTMGQLTGDIQKDMKMLMNFVFNQTEEMRYLLDNLDVTNFNDLGLARYENGRMQIYTKKLDLRTEKLTAEFQDADEQTKTTLEASIGGLRTEVEEEVEGLGQWISTVEQTANGLKSTVSSQGTSISDLGTRVSTVEQTASRIQTTVTSQDNTLNTHTNNISALQGTTVNLQSQITQQANSISLVVSNGSINAASIVTAINSAGSSVKISADHVNISGLVTVSDLKGNGTVEINAGNIMAGGTISGVALESRGSASWEEVLIANGMVEFYSGHIRDYDLGVLGIYGSTETRIYVRNGNYFRFANGYLAYCNGNTDAIISQAIFQ